MPLPQHLSIRHHFPSFKGRIIDAPGVDGGIWMVDPNGGVLARGFKLKILDITTTQPSEAAAPVEMVHIQVTKAKEDGGRQTYKIVQPLKKLADNFPEVIREGVGQDADFDEKDPYDKLLLLVLAASDNRAQATAPTYNSLQWTEPNGWLDHGKLVCHAPVEINREIRTESGETLYRLRVPRANGTGFDYTTCTRAELLSGTYYFSERSISVPDSIKTAIAVLTRWESLPQGDRVAQENEEYTQPDRDAKEARDRQFRIHGYRTNSL